MWPSSYLLQRVPSAKYLSGCSICWSVVALLIPACRDWGDLMVLRFLMGESAEIGWRKQIIYESCISGCRLSILLIDQKLVRLPGRNYNSIDFPRHCGFLQKIRTTSSKRACFCCRELHHQRVSILGCGSYPFICSSCNLAVPVLDYR
jgi:hypothetical protein